MLIQKRPWALCHKPRACFHNIILKRMTGPPLWCLDPYGSDQYRHLWDRIFIGCFLILQKEKRKRNYGKKKEYNCSCCGRNVPFCWKCPCGFQICNTCMEENLWGMTCSGTHWQCPDCGKMRPFWGSWSFEIHGEKMYAISLPKDV